MKNYYASAWSKLLIDDLDKTALKKVAKRLGPKATAVLETAQKNKQLKSSELAKRLGKRRPAISQHLKKIRDAADAYRGQHAK